MTSQPASRSAPAMTLAPRSWPSRPGLAISTRGRRPAGTRALLASLISEVGRWPILAEHGAQAACDPADRGLGAHRRQHWRHQIVGAARSRLYRGKRPLDRRRVARSAQLAQARALIPLHLGVGTV